ncbi:Asx homology domain-containing protein [Aspergillus ambiguus]|uniref:uncharacterized protein n=1 Tax=Aspergillus ambiguus TaxID=176160 RepID=UPI003CCD2E1F
MSSGNTRPKRNPRRAAKDRFEEHKLLTSPTSQLVDLDLVKLLARPEAWDCLEEAEKEEILKLLPDDVQPNSDPSSDDPDAKIPPLPQSFLRYSNNWRDGVRHFQLDLQLGRYDPEWLRQAEEATQQRAAGKFDKFKEQEFEEFWGQKQKVDLSLPSGESAQVRFSTLVEQGCFRTGDVFKFSRAFTKAKDKILVEKEARVVEIHGGKLSFSTPPGQRVFLPVIAAASPEGLTTRGAVRSHTSSAVIVEAKDPTKEPEEARLKDYHTKEHASSDPTVLHRPTKRARIAANDQPEPDRFPAHSESEPVNTTKSMATLPAEAHDEHGVSEREQPLVKDDEETNSKPENGHEEPDGSVDVPSASENGSSAVENNPAGAHEVIIRNIQTPNTLRTKIVAIDGRLTSTSHGNPWKDFRCYRDNQDMGSLWDIRERWFVNNNKGSKTADP